MDKAPLVSIGLPVFNGERYIPQALDSLLAQSYDNFELNISDNASTDGTEEICRLYAAKDHRVHYYRQPRNVGLMGNWRCVLQLASGEYFMWAQHDDCWSMNYIGTLLKCLLACPGAILAAGRTLYIDGDGNPYHLDPDDAPVRHGNGSISTAKQLLQQHAQGWLHGLFRRDELLRLVPTFFAGDPWGADIVFVLELCLSQEIVGSDAAVMYKRVSGGINGPKTPRQRVKWQCWFARALLQVIRKSSLSTNEKREVFKAYVLYLKWLYFRRGILSWAKLWGRAGFDWLTGMNR
jgi:glycosyltransferase involved in cell wall biosynthesis